ncbi:MAG TPA: Crp/Fnr family transcriptional regulator [Devosiaceae bacterium]
MKSAKECDLSKDPDRKDVHNSGIPRICSACEARYRGICGALEPDELVALSRVSRQVSAGAGEELLADSEPVSTYANVMHGVVKLSKMLADGRQQVVGLQFAPDFLGRLFAAENRLTAEAASEVELCRFPRSALDQMIADNPGLERRLLQQTLHELDEARDWMVTLGRKTAAEKVASFIYLIATHFDPEIESGTAQELSFDLPLSRADIADFLGLTVETVSRQLTRLRLDGVIRIANNRHLTIPDPERLKGRCG